MRKLVLIVLVAAAAYYAYTSQVHQAATGTVVAETAGPPEALAADAAESSTILGRAFANQQSNLQVEVIAVVDKVLSDDNDGAKHQRFVVKLASGQTVLIAHNIDLAPRVPLAEGDRVTVYGEYEWNSKGGVVHWTHRDPAGRHIPGWIKHAGQTYQ